MMTVIKPESIFSKKELEEIQIADGPIFVPKGTKQPVVVKPKEFNTLEEIKQYVLKHKNKIWIFCVYAFDSEQRKKGFSPFKLLRHE
jgi:hypothetical protein